MSFQMVLLLALALQGCAVSFGTMSFQMVLLQNISAEIWKACFGTMSFQMVLLRAADNTGGGKAFWNYVIPDGSTTGSAAETINC